MIQAIVKAEHFCVGITHIPVGGEVTLPEPVVAQLVKDGKLEYRTEQTEAAPQGYNRRDMQAQQAPVEVVAAPVKPKAKRVRRTNAQIERDRQNKLSKGK